MIESLEAPDLGAPTRKHSFELGEGSAPIQLGKLPPGQFRIFAASSPFARQEVFEESLRIPFGDFVVEWDQHLRSTLIQDADLSTIAVVLGHAFNVDTGRRLSSDDFKGYLTSLDQQEAFETIYEKSYGAFIILLMVDGIPFVYLDAGGCLSAVYSRKLAIVGATAAAILTEREYERLFDRELYDYLDVANEGWFPSDLTAHRNVSRLLCNHRLDLRSLSAARHWPSQVPVRSTKDADILDALGRSLRNNINAILANMPTAMGFTAGFDSRTLLALVPRERRQDLTTFVVDAGTPNTDIDVHVSNRIARHFGLNHKTLAPLPRDEDGEKRWHRGCGHAIGGTNARQHTALSRLVPMEAIIDGVGAETARCFYWKKHDADDSALIGEMIVRRFGMPAAAELVAATDRWLAGVPQGGALFTLDLAYLELRVSSWACVGCYVDSPMTHFSPYLSRRSIEAMFALPIATKRANAMARAIIAANWPELMAFPFNKYGDIRDLIRTLRKAKNLNVVTKKLRKLLAP